MCSPTAISPCGTDLIKAAVTEGLGNGRGLHGWVVAQIGNGSPHSQHPLGGPRAQAPLIDRRLPQVEGFSTAHFSARNAIRPQSQGRTHEISQCCDARAGAQRNEIGGIALKLARVFDEDYPVLRLGNLAKQRIDEGGFAG